MRGKVRTVDRCIVGFRITPAYAGKSVLLLVDEDYFRDHPRLCGEKRLRFSVRWIALGSPPPMRGKAPRCSVGACCPRITPAYAGKSSFLDTAHFGR